MTLSTKTPLLISLAIASIALTTSHAQDWPQWMGPNRDAKAPGFKAPKSWPAELPQKWKVTVGDGVATPALSGDKLYVFSREDGNEVIRCLEADTGKELWQDKYETLPATGPAQGFSGPRSCPAVAEGKVVTLGLRGTVSCYDASSGKLLWRKDEYPGKFPRFFTSSSPIIADGLAVLQLGGGNEGGVFAYDLGSGDVKWKWTGDGPAYASLNAVAVSGAKYTIAETDSKIVALTLGDGKLAWETPFAVQGRGYNAATPLVHGQTIYYAGSGRGATAVKLEKSGDGLSSSEVWKNTDNSVQFNTPILKDNLLFGLSAGNDLFCINATDGRTAWTASLSGSSDQQQGQGGRRRGGGRGGYGSLVDAGSVMLALTPSSELIVFEPKAEAYSEIARIKIADSPTYAYPVVSGNRIFIKDQNDLALYSVE